MAGFIVPVSAVTKKKKTDVPSTGRASQQISKIGSGDKYILKTIMHKLHAPKKDRHN